MPAPTSSQTPEMSPRPGGCWCVIGGPRDEFLVMWPKPLRACGHVERSTTTETQPYADPQIWMFVSTPDLFLIPSGPRLLCYVGPLRTTMRTSRGRTAYRTFFVTEVQVRPLSRRRYAAGPQPARGASRSCQRVIRPQLLLGRSRYLFFSVLLTLQPLYSSVLFKS